MKNLDLREKYYYNLKNALIYPLKNSDGMLNLASMQRVFIKDSVLILVKGDNKISVMNSETSEFEYYIFNDEDSIVKYVTTTFVNGQILITFSLVNEDLVIKSGGAIMEINDIETINQIEKVIANNLINTIINIQKTGYANILSVTSVDNAITQENTLLEDLKYKKIDVLNKLNSDLTRKRRI
ncbi:MAG: hypothetical protein SO484_02110 [Bacilli bacterium]|nr:hypothetical protein [Bacilli bacterium]